MGILTDYEKVRAAAGSYLTGDQYKEQQAAKQQEEIRRAVPKFEADGQYIGMLAGKNDPVNSPSHYTSGGIETIDFIEAKKLNYNLGNTVKYITRAGKKDNTIQDLEKAAWYLAREIKTLKGN